MKLRNRESYLSAAPDGVPKPRKAPRLFHYFYIFLLIFIVGLGIYYFTMNSVLYFHGTGFVQPERFYVHTYSHCEVVKFFVKEKQVVKKGDPLVEVQFVENIKKAGTPSKLAFALTNIDEQIDVLEKILKQKEVELGESVLFKSIRKEKSEDNTILSKERENYSEIKDEYDSVLKELNMLKTERIGFLTPDKKPESRQSYTHTKDMTTIINSQFDGYVSRIFKKRYEFAEEGANLMIIEDPAVIVINAVFKTRFLKYLDEDKNVLIRFPNGQTALGIINRSYTSSYFQGQRLPEEETIVEISPAVSGKSNLWEKYKGLEVELRVSRF